MENITIRTTIAPSLMRYTLFRGTFLACLGTILLLYAISLPIEKLRLWGFPIFVSSIVLITIGMLPYRRLVKNEQIPDKLMLDEDHSVTYIRKKQKMFTIPQSRIASSKYVKKGRSYGIGLWLTDTEEKIVIHNPRFNLVKFQKKAKGRWECDLFFPYFSERSYRVLFENRTKD